MHSKVNLEEISRLQYCRYLETLNESIGSYLLCHRHLVYSALHNDSSSNLWEIQHQIRNRFPQPGLLFHLRSFRLFPSWSSRVGSFYEHMLWLDDVLRQPSWCYCTYSLHLPSSYALSIVFPRLWSSKRYRWKYLMSETCYRWIQHSLRWREMRNIRWRAQQEPPQQQPLERCDLLWIILKLPLGVDSSCEYLAKADSWWLCLLSWCSLGLLFLGFLLFLFLLLSGACITVSTLVKSAQALSYQPLHLAPLRRRSPPPQQAAPRVCPLVPQLS